MLAKMCWFSKRGNGLSGGGGTISYDKMPYAQLEELVEARSTLSQQLQQAKEEITRIPTKREIDRKMDEMIRDGLITPDIKKFFEKLYELGRVEEGITHEFVKWGRGYQYNAEPRPGTSPHEHQETLSNVDIANLRWVEIRGLGDMTKRKRQEIARDVGGYITGIGRHNPIARDVYDATLKALSDFDKDNSITNPNALYDEWKKRASSSKK